MGSVSLPPVGSVAEPRRMAPAIMALAGLLVVVEASVLFGNGEGLLAALAIFGPPTIGTTLAARHVVEDNGWVGLLAPLGVAVLHAVLFALWNNEAGMALGATFVIWVITGVLALPMLGIVGVLRTRRAHDAGDVLLGAAGAWILVLTVAAAGVFGDRAAFLAPGLLVGVAAMAVASIRGLRRRAWCRRAARGLVDGVRVRPATSDEPEHLVPIYGATDRATAVVERIAPGTPGTGTAYRDPLVYIPLALAPGDLATS